MLCGFYTDSDGKLLPSSCSSDELKCLGIVDITNQNIISIPEEVFQWFPNAYEMHLEGNRLTSMPTIPHEDMKALKRLSVDKPQACDACVLVPELARHTSPYFNTYDSKTESYDSTTGMRYPGIYTWSQALRKYEMFSCPCGGAPAAPPMPPFPGAPPGSGGKTIFVSLRIEGLERISSPSSSYRPLPTPGEVDFQNCSNPDTVSVGGSSYYPTALVSRPQIIGSDFSLYDFHINDFKKAVALASDADYLDQVTVHNFRPQPRRRWYKCPLCIGSNYGCRSISEKCITMCMYYTDDYCTYFEEYTALQVTFSVSFFNTHEDDLKAKLFTELRLHDRPKLLFFDIGDDTEVTSSLRSTCLTVNEYSVDGNITLPSASPSSSDKFNPSPPAPDKNSHHGARQGGAGDSGDGGSSSEHTNLNKAVFIGVLIVVIIAATIFIYRRNKTEGSVTEVDEAEGIDRGAERWSTRKTGLVNLHDLWRRYGIVPRWKRKEVELTQNDNEVQFSPLTNEESGRAIESVEHVASIKAEEGE